MMFDETLFFWMIVIYGVIFAAAIIGAWEFLKWLIL